MPAVPAIQSRESIVHGVETVKTRNAGTGQWMSVWMGWMPMRVTVALFELESDRFILRREKVPQKAEEEGRPYRAENEDLLYRAKDDDSLETTRNPASCKKPVEEKRSAIAYGNAEVPELLHASVIAQKAILKLHERGRNGDDASVLSGDEVLSNEIMLLDDDNESKKRLGASLYEALVTELPNIKVLKKAVEVLVLDYSSSRDVRRALFLIERFCSSTGLWFPSNLEELEIKRLLIRDDSVAMEIHKLLEMLLNQSRFQAVVSESYAKICTSLDNFRLCENRNKMCVALCTSILRAAPSSSASRKQTIRILGSTLRCESEDNAALC